jgi:hypothetical protein
MLNVMGLNAALNQGGAVAGVVYDTPIDTTLYAISNSWMDANAPTTINGYDTTYFATGQFGGSQTNRGLLLFDITSIPHDAIINSVSLKITVQSNFLGTSHTINIYRLKRKWYSNGVSTTYRTINRSSYNNYREDLTPDLAWGTAGANNTTTDRDASPIGSIAVTSATAGTKTITLDPALVQGWIDGAFVNNGLILIASDEVNTTLMRWQSLINATPGNRPQLVINYTPVKRTLLDSLIAYWTHDDVYTDASGNGHALTAHASPTFVAGKINNASHFVAASSQWLSSSDAALKKGNSDWTWVGWVKLTDNTDYHVIAGQSEVGLDGGWKIFYHKVDILDYFVLQIYDDGTESGVDDHVICDTIAYTSGHPATGTWIFIACRHDSVRNFGQIFINSSVPDSGGTHWTSGEYGYSNYYAPYPGTPLTSTEDFTLGRVNADSQFHNGDIDESGFWNRCLSDAEIASLYNSGTGLTHPFT